MIAGPNGSGKSTLIELLSKAAELGVYVNADDIEASLNKKPLLHFEDYSIKSNQRDFLSLAIKIRLVLQSLKAWLALLLVLKKISLLFGKRS